MDLSVRDSNIGKGTKTAFFEEKCSKSILSPPPLIDATTSRPIVESVERETASSLL